MHEDAYPNFIITRRYIMRKKMLAMAMACTMVLASFTACGSGSGTGTSGTSNDASSKKDDKSEQTSSGPVDLTLWGAEGDQDYLKGIVEKFKTKYSNQEFNIQIGVKSEADAKDDVLKDIEAAADVYSFASDQLNDLVKAGALADLSKISDALSAQAGKSIDDVKSEHIEDAIEAASLDGKLYAFPTSGGNSFFLYYDSSVISEDDAKSWDTLLAAADKAGKKVGMTLNSGWYNSAFFYGAGFTTGLNADGTTTMDWNGTSADGVSGTDVTKAMLNIASNSAFRAMPDGKGSDILASGDLCASISGLWDAGTAGKVFGKNYAATKLPTFKAGDKDIQMAPAYGYKFEAVNAYSKNIGWAAVLAEFISNEESQTAHFEMTEQAEIIPTNKKSLENDKIAKNVAIAAVNSESDIGVTQVVGGKFWDPAATFGEIIAKGKLKADDDAGIQKALDDLVAGVTAKVD